MYWSYSKDLLGLKHDTLRERLTKNADSIATCTEEMKIAYVEDLENVVSMAILTATLLQPGFASAASAVLAIIAARYAGPQGLPIVQPADVPTETWAAWVAAKAHNVPSSTWTMGDSRSISRLTNHNRIGLTKPVSILSPSDGVSRKRWEHGSRSIPSQRRTLSTYTNIGQSLLDGRTVGLWRTDT